MRGRAHITGSGAGESEERMPVCVGEQEQRASSIPTLHRQSSSKVVRPALILNQGKRKINSKAQVTGKVRMPTLLAALE